MKKLLIAGFLLINFFSGLYSIEKNRLDFIGKTSFLSFMQRDEFTAKEKILCTIETELSKAELISRGYQVQTKVGNFATLFIHLDDLAALEKANYIKRVLFLGKDEPLLEESTSAKMNGVNYVGCDADYLQSLGLDGSGVIIGILDFFPLNWKHDDFSVTHWSNDLRVLAIWDQRNNSGPHPYDFDYGTEYRKADLMADNGPAITSGNHGTQCTGIAAGDGSGSGIGSPNMGMAPNAEIIYVRTIGYRENTIDALSFFAQKAQEYGKPIVVNYSGGSKYGLTDGSDPGSVAFYEFGAAGRFATVAAGNYYTTTKHAQSTTTFGNPTNDINFQITGYTNSDSLQFSDFLDVIFYFRNGDDFDVTVWDPDNNSYSHTIGEEAAFYDTDFGRLYFFRSDYPSIEVVITDEVGTVAVNDAWTIGLSCPAANFDNMGGVWSAWMFEKNITANFTNYATGENTVNIYSSDDKTMSVGAHYKTTGALYGGCSAGPTIDGRIKPDITAPTGATAPDNSGTDTYTALGATSGAAPHAAGLAALLFQLYPDYTPSEIHSLFRQSGWADNYTNAQGALPNWRFGYGKMNAPGVYESTAAANVEQVVDTDDVPYSFTDADVQISFSGLSSAQTITVLQYSQAPLNHDLIEQYISNFRWVLTGEGFATATLYFDYTQLSGISDPHTVNVYQRANEGSGSFGSALPKSIENNFIVVTVTEFSEFALTSNDEDNPLPAMLAFFNVSYEQNAGLVQWQTYSETNNAGWNLYKSREIDDFHVAYLLNTSGLIAGNGTTTATNHYLFSDVSPLEAGTEYFYWLESVSFAGESFVYEPASLLWQEPAEPEAPGIVNFGLQQNFPNPFNPATVISFALTSTSYGELSIYNLKGKKVRTLFQGEITGNMQYEIVWDGMDSRGKAVASSIYFYRLKTDNYLQVKKMMLLK